MITPRITLTLAQVASADTLARMRQNSAVSNRRRTGNGATSEPTQALNMHIMGARAEMAARIYLGPVEWNAYTDGSVHGLPDFQDWIDVRGRAKDYYELIVKPADRPDLAYVLISTEKHPTYWLRGWVWGSEAKNPRFWKDPGTGRPAFFVPAQELRPMHEMYDMVWEKERRLAA